VLKDQVMQALKSTSDLVVPKSLTELEAKNLLSRAKNELKNSGVKTEDIELTEDAFRPQAEERVAFGLIVNEVVRQFHLQAKQEQVRVLVEEAAQSYEQPQAVVRWHYEKPERLNEYEARAVEHNVIGWALSRAQVRDQATTFAALMEPAPRA
jgi:trigger factor